MKRLWDRLRNWWLPRWPEVPDEVAQSIAEQNRVRTEYIRSQAHPKYCDTECRCRPEDFPGGAA